MSSQPISGQDSSQDLSQPTAKWQQLQVLSRRGSSSWGQPTPGGTVGAIRTPHRCNTAKEMWEKLQVTYEGTSQVKKSKIYMLVKEYEMFKMKESDSITFMFTQFTHIKNGFKALGREYSMEDNVQKVLRLLPESWHAKSTVIEEAKDLFIVTLDELIESLMTYEIKKKNATAEVEKPKKTIDMALNTTRKKKIMEEEESDNDEETALITRKIRRYLLIKKASKQKDKGESSTRCFNCKNSEHRIAECPQFKRGNNQQGDKKKYKAMNTTEWDELDGLFTDGENEEEVANFCFMADEQDEANFDDEYSSSYDELEETCRKIYNELIVTKKINKHLEETHSKCKRKEVCLKTSSIKNKWFLDSRCSRHMMGNANKFISLYYKKEGLLTFGDNTKGRIIGKGKIGNSSLSINNVALVDTLKHNLLTVSHLYDKGLNVVFQSTKCIIIDLNGNAFLVGKRESNINTIEFNDINSYDIRCLAVISETSWLWHKRLGHASMDLLHRLSSKELVNHLPKDSYIKDKVCDAFQYGK
ncbi:uncharacterized protein LOC131160121 [Malania oleifera]|uniref:uncharacterized protein LOC131160121 n=1 Tax=Malania oleifera TaxID=397392 RepID=UPI0025AEAC9F|nr:uncharacterized protein LOC131160121 [Malania oleifera]